MKKILPIIFGLVVGLVFTKLFYSSYNATMTFNESVNVYVFQQGVYSSLDSVKENVNLNYYIYEKNGDMYYVYSAFTTNYNNVDKLKGYFEDLGYSIYVKEVNMNANNFTETLKQYDLLLEKTNDQKTIEAINANVLSVYEEVYNENKEYSSE